MSTDSSPCKARFALWFAVVLLACGAVRVDAAPVLTLTYQPTKAFRFTWTSEPGANHYKLLEDPTGNSGFTQVGASIAAPAITAEHIVPLYRRVNARYKLQACNFDQCVDSNVVTASAPLTRAIGYFKASNPGQFDAFGSAVALSADGTTMAVGARYEGSGAVGVNGNQLDNSVRNAGAVYVFVRNGSGSAWVQQAYIKASNTGRDDIFGSALTLSANGSMLAVGAPWEDSAATGVNGNQSDDSAVQAGAVYVFARSGSSWAQQAYIKASNAERGDSFGSSVAFSGDARTLVVGAHYERSNAVGVDGDQSNNDASDSGAAYVFTRTGNAWSQQAYLKASNTRAEDLFGASVDISNDGLVIAVGAPREDGADAGVNGDQTALYGIDVGAVYVFARLGSLWVQEAYVKASNATDGYEFGLPVALSANGAVLAVGAGREGSRATGVNGDQNDNGASGSGAAYVFGRRESVWTQQAYMKASNTAADDGFGWALALSNDGATLAVGAAGEDSNAIGMDGDAANNAVLNAGAVYVFGKNNGVWAQRSYVKASNTSSLNPNMCFGMSLALAGNGATLAVAAELEMRRTSGVNGPQDLTPLWIQVGAVYVY